MILFHSDLDNTLIYSYRHDIGPEKKCVELYQGKELSFMKPEWIETIRRIRKKILFIPTTTRTLEQYRRIDMGIGVPEFALVCNGGILLRNGKTDDSWYRESLRLISDAGEELDKAVQFLTADPERNFEVRFIERLFVFTKSGKPEESVLRLKERLDGKKVDVFQNGVKVYVVPKGLDKGTGIIRLRKALGAEHSIAAGDSEFDKSMLLAADAGMCPEGLFLEKQKSIWNFPESVFTDKMLNTLEELLSGNVLEPEI